VSSSEKLFIGEYFNGHVGATRRDLREYMDVLDIANKTKMKKKS
jgi:hypothetical protein